MHVHLPKPIHGWRQFFGEVGIIVLGDDAYMRRRFNALGIKPDRSDFAADIDTAGCSKSDGR